VGDALLLWAIRLLTSPTPEKSGADTRDRAEARRLRHRVEGDDDVVEEERLRRGAADAGGATYRQRGWRVGAAVFSDVVAQIRAKFPDASPAEVRQGAIDKLSSPTIRNRLLGAPELKAKVQHAIGDAFWIKWVDENHGVTTFLGDARRVCARCFGLALVDGKDPLLDYWKGKSKLPDVMK